MKAAVSTRKSSRNNLDQSFPDKVSTDVIKESSPTTVASLGSFPF